MATKQISLSWSDLPSDLLSKIFEKLKGRDDHFNCSSVCESWKKVIENQYPQLKPYFPFLSGKNKPILPPFLMLSNTKTNKNQQSCLFFNLFKDQKIKIHRPELQDTWFCSSSHGWLLTIPFSTEQNICLLNPITGSQIKLPPAPKDFEKPQYLRLITSTNPSDPSCMILAQTTSDSHNSKLAICRTGHKNWTRVSEFYRFCSDAIFYKGQFYAIDFLGHIHRIIYDGIYFKAVELSIQPAKLAFVDNYLVEFNGYLLLVQRFITSRPYGFNVYRLNWQSYQWIELENIGDNVILLGKSCSKIIAATGDFAANCIYYIDDAGKMMSDHLLGCGVGVFNFATKLYQGLERVSDLDELNWFTPD